MTVPEGVTLIIESGVTVYFTDEVYPCHLKVWSKLVLKGTDSERQRAWKVERQSIGGDRFL